MTKKYRLTTDIFLLPDADGNIILYAPLVGFVGRVNESLLFLLNNLDQLSIDKMDSQQIRMLEYLQQKKVLNGPDFASLLIKHDEFIPENMALFPTNGCQLRCRYCYAIAGDHPKKIMNWSIASTAVENFAAALEQHGQNVFNLEFHGGGEPFYDFALVKRIVDRAKEVCIQKHLSLSLTAGTNGILSTWQLDWITAHFSYLVISFDGLEEVQNHTRPMANGGHSFPIVDGTLKKLAQYNFPHAIRCTVTAINQHRLHEIIEFIANNYRPDRVFFEPVTSCGRATDSQKTLMPNIDVFTENYLELESFGRSRGIDLVFSAARVERISATFCHVGTNDFAVTPDGFLTNCWQVCDSDDPLSLLYFFGRVIPDQGFELDYHRLQHLKAMNVTKLPFCQDCFAKWHCAGYCALDREFSIGTKETETTSRCQIIRRLMADRIKKCL